jgi:ABC-type nickel/cobalt efflux system permease component RcnA
MSTRIITGIFAAISLTGSAATFVFGLLTIARANAIFQEIAGGLLLLISATLLVSVAAFVLIDQSERIRQDVAEYLDRLEKSQVKLPSVPQRPAPPPVR